MIDNELGMDMHDVVMELQLKMKTVGLFRVLEELSKSFDKDIEHFAKQMAIDSDPFKLVWKKMYDNLTKLKGDVEVCLKALVDNGSGNK